MALECGIAAHLVCERTLPAKTPADYHPPFPAYVARFPADLKDLVMAVMGAQHNNGKPSELNIARSKLTSFLDKGPVHCRPEYQQPSSLTDSSGAFNEVVVAYWRSKAHYNEWSAASGFDRWWQGLDPHNEDHGWFLEVFFPPVDRFETVFSNNVVPEGAAHMRECVSGEIQEHVYWGSMRDRLPIAQTDTIEGVKADFHGGHGEDSTSKRIRVAGRRNLAVIRSGQDWSNTTLVERTLYLDTMHPVLIRGMNFLSDHGDEVGCISCRFMDVLDSQGGSGTEKTFGLAYFDDLSSLEGWSKHHQTHLDIFGGFLKYASKLQGDVSLRLFHEVLVLEADQQYLEYVGCHNETGMLAAQ
ncbi:hypothetical protein LTR10_004015 [Elasticomyces elasticus]|nr:hypothetical protein LTR10_004015 [Elasticomyces elasticus]